jgi:hypothetical protein
MNLPVSGDESAGIGPDHDAPPASERDRARPSVSRKQLDDIFGDVLPTVTRDEIDDERDRAGNDDRDRWYRDNRPPHHE